MKKWPEQQAATFQEGKGSHLKVFLNSKQSTLHNARHSGHGKGLEAAIKTPAWLEIRRKNHV